MTIGLYLKHEMRSYMRMHRPFSHLHRYHNEIVWLKDRCLRHIPALPFPLFSAAVQISYIPMANTDTADQPGTDDRRNSDTFRSLFHFDPTATDHE